MAQISNFKAAITRGGSRSNQFRVSIAAPFGDFKDLPILCSAASLPAVNVDPVSLMYRGRQVNFAGERTYEPWTITVINDMGGASSLRDSFERWSNEITVFDGSNGLTAPLSYMGRLTVEQLDRNGETLKTYTFEYAFPTNIGQIGLSYDNPNIETFDVTFVYDFYTPNIQGEKKATAL